jgi:Flp pilus assembly pilin Flp
MELAISKLLVTLKSLLPRDEEGATATEYIVLLVFVAIAIIAGTIILGGALNGAFEDASTRVGTGL